MPDVVLATCSDLPGGDEDAALLTAALDAVGVTARWTVWDDPAAVWDDAAVVLRSTWDYHARLDDFVAWTRTVPRLYNRAEIVEWNTDKTYLGELAAAGVPTVESSFYRVADAADAGSLDGLELPGRGEFVVKPSVGAGSRGAGRFSAASLPAAREHAAALLTAGRTVLVQPFLDTVDTEGETALLYADGVFSHAIRKGPMLTADTAHPVSGASLFIAENITPRVPDAAQRTVGDQALAFVRDRFGVTPLYARVDLLASPTGPVVTELELTEPSLFLGYDDDAASRFAHAIAAVT